MEQKKITQEEQDIRMLIKHKNGQGISLTKEEEQIALKYMPEEEIPGLVRKYIKRTGCNSLDKITFTPQAVFNKPLS